MQIVNDVNSIYQQYFNSRCSYIQTNYIPLKIFTFNAPVLTYDAQVHRDIFSIRRFFFKYCERDIECNWMSSVAKMKNKLRVHIDYLAFDRFYILLSIRDDTSTRRKMACKIYISKLLLKAIKTNELDKLVYELKDVMLGITKVIKMG